jgi:hypothetical protein
MKRFYSIRSFMTGLGFFTTWSVITANAQLTLTGTNYFQNFNDLDSGLPAGWLVYTNAHATNVGTAASFVTDHTSWATATGQFLNSAGTSNSGTNLLGTESSNLQNNYTNRAPAIRQTGAFGDPGAAFVLNITNTSGLATFQLSLDFLMLSVQAHSNLWTVDYAVGNAPTNFLPLATYGDPSVFGAMHTNLDFGTALDNQHSNVWIRVVALNASMGNSGSRDTFGIDNFSLSWTTGATPSPPAITAITITNNNVQIDFHGSSSDTVASYTLQSANQVSGAYNDTGATITQTSPGIFRAVRAMNGSQQFYRVKHQ